MRRRAALLAWILAGIALAIPFHADALEPLGLVAPVPALVLAARDPKLGFVRAWIFGFAFVLAGLPWLIAVHPVAWIGCAAHYGLYAAAGAWALSRLHAAGWPLVVAAPACVLAYETLVQRFSLFESTWLAFGALAWRVPELVQPAALGGVSLISAALWALPAGLVDAWLRARREGWAVLRTRAGLVPPLLGALALPALFVLGAAMMPEIGAPVMKVQVVQANVPQSFRNRAANAYSILDEHVILTFQHAEEGLDLIAWTESAATIALEDEPEVLEKLGRLARRLGAPLLVGAIGLNGEGEPPSNSAFLIDGPGSIAGRSDKRKLVPGAETLPVIGSFPPLRDAVGEYLSRTMHFRPFLRPGDRPVILRAGADAAIPFGVLVCYDDVVPAPAEELRAAGAAALVTITNEAWFGRGEPRQHLALAIFRCIETRLPMARGGNIGTTCLIDPAGRVTERLWDWTDGALVGELVSTGAKPVPPWVRAIPSWLSVALVVAALARAALVRRAGQGGAP